MRTNLHSWQQCNTYKAFSKRKKKNQVFVLPLTGYVWFGGMKLILMITWPALCPAGSTFWNKTPKSQLPINRVSSSFFCLTSTGITESNRMQYGPFHRSNISKLNFASGRTASPASSTLVKLSLNSTVTFG